MESNLLVNNEATSSVAPVQSTTTEPEKGSAQTPKTPKLPWICVLISGIIAIAGLCFGIYAMTKPAETANTDNLKVQVKNADGTTTTLKTDKIEKTNDNGTTITITDSAEGYSLDRVEVQKIVDKLREGIEISINQNNIFAKTYSEGTIIKIPDTELFTSSDEAYGIKSVPNLDSALEKRILNNALKYTESFLTDNGFTRITHPYWTETPYYYNSSNKTYCFVNGYSMPFEVNCAKETWITESEKKLILELSKADETVNYISAKSVKVTDSPVSPYQYAIASIGRAYGLFYRVSPDSEWQFFTATQAELSCSEFTGDVAKAYAGYTCWDQTTEQQSTVQP